MNGQSTKSSCISASVTSPVIPMYLRAGVASVTSAPCSVYLRTRGLVKSAKRRAEGVSSIAEASIAVYIDSDASVFMATLWR